MKGVMSLKKPFTAQGTRCTHFVSPVPQRIEKSEKLTINNQRPPQPLRIMILQNTQRLPALAHAGIAPRRTLLEIHQQTQRLLARHHQVDHALDHEYQMLHLPLAAFGVLFPRVEIQTRARRDVVAQDDLFARFVLGRYVAGRVRGEAVFAAPGEGREESAGCVGRVPFRGAQVAEETFACEPHAFVVGDGGCGAVGCGACGDGGPCRDGVKEGVVFGLLLGG